MAKVDLVMPKMGESIIEATILKWNKKPGDTIKLDENVLDIATDKVDSEVPSPVEGILLQLNYKEGDVVPVGAAIAVIETQAAGGAVTAPVADNGKHEAQVIQQSVQTLVQTVAQPAVVLEKNQSGRFYSPLVLNIAREENISMDELERIPGTGENGRVTKKDILAYVKNRSNAPVQQVAQSSTPPEVQQQTAKSQPLTNGQGGVQIAAKSYNHGSNYDIIEMDRMRKLISENMVYSKHVSAHVTSFVEADVTNLVAWRDKVKGAFEKKYGEKLTFTPIFLECLARALRDFPIVNSSVDGDRILVKKDINIGIAVALPNDNLIVPNIRNADRMNLVGLSAATNDLANRARNNKLKLEELEGGTYTLSNVGTFGNVMGTPVINQPQVAVLAAGSIRKKPAVIETPHGDFIGIRQLMFLSHSYDHRIIDGSVGGKFVRRVADYLENWDINREI